MSEPIGMMIEIGGKLSAKKIGDFISAINDDLSELWDNPFTENEIEKYANGKSLTISGLSNYGECDDLKKFLRENKLSYIHTIEGKYEYNGEVKFWTPKMPDEVSVQADQGGNPVVNMALLKNLEKHITFAMDRLWDSQGEVMEHLEKIKFEIIDKLPPMPPKKLPALKLCALL